MKKLSTWSSLWLGLSLCASLIVSLYGIIKSVKDFWCHGDRLAIISYLMLVFALISPLARSSKEIDALLFTFFNSRLRSSALALTTALAPLLWFSGLASAFGGVGCALFLDCAFGFGLGVVGIVASLTCVSHFDSSVVVSTLLTFFFDFAFTEEAFILGSVPQRSILYQGDFNKRE